MLSPWDISKSHKNTALFHNISMDIICDKAVVGNML